MNERDIIDGMIAHKRDSIDFFGAANKAARERMIMEAFLRSRDIEFSAKDVRPISGEFPDVQFKADLYELKEALDPGRQRHREIKEDLRALENAQDLSELIEPYEPRTITLDDLAGNVDMILEDLRKKYPADQRAATNLLIYFNLQFISIGGDPKLKRGVGADWRSVSVVGNSWSAVLHAGPNAPAYLSTNNGQLIRRNGWL